MHVQHQELRFRRGYIGQRCTKREIEIGTVNIHIKTVEAEMVKLQKTLDMLKFKCWYYETAIHDGNEDRLNTMLPDRLPPDMQKLFDNAHS